MLCGHKTAAQRSQECHCATAFSTDEKGPTETAGPEQKSAPKQLITNDGEYSAGPRGRWPASGTPANIPRWPQQYPPKYA